MVASNDATGTENNVSVLVEAGAALETRLAELVKTIAQLERRERTLLRNLAALEVAIAAMRRAVQPRTPA